MTITVGFIGLGTMGGPMAANIGRAGFPLQVWNRTPAKAGTLLDAGATWCASPADVAAACDVVVTMVTDDAAVEEVLFGPAGAAAALPHGAVVVDMSTTSPDQATSVGARLAEAGIGFVDAPVFGSLAEARAGLLTAVVGGAEADLALARPVLNVLCQSVRVMGVVGSGSAMKVAGNLVILGMIDLLAEGMALGAAWGLAPSAVLGAISGNPDIACALFTGKGEQVVANDYSPRFALKHAWKDIRLALTVGATAGLDFPATRGVAQAFENASRAGLADKDCMAVIRPLIERRMAPD